MVTNLKSTGVMYIPLCAQPCTIYTCNVPKTVRIYLAIFSDYTSVYATEGSAMCLETYARPPVNEVVM